MADLAPLIRVRKHEVEQKQKTLAEFYRQAGILKDKRDAMETQLAIEAEKTKNMSDEMLGFFEPYAVSVRAQVEEIDEDRKKIEGLITMAQDDVRDAFAELKKIEIIDERRAEEQLAELEKKESDTLDEIAIDGFRRGDE